MFNVSSPCDHVCNNTVGSYTCSCYSGFKQLNKETCVSVGTVKSGQVRSGQVRCLMSPARVTTSVTTPWGVTRAAVTADSNCSTKKRVSVGTIRSGQVRSGQSV